ncbi:MAG: PAS domain-containing sensor histidine kinase [Armatimonadota bacterium]|nr:PAS domain-containing sensor histidine kinase [Armatimonadota bacterium]
MYDNFDNLAKSEAYVGEQVLSPMKIPLQSLVDVDVLLAHYVQLSNITGGAVSAFRYDESGPTPLMDGREMIWHGSPICARLGNGKHECLRHHWRSAIAAMQSGEITEGGCTCGDYLLLSCPIMLERNGQNWPKACVTFMICSRDSIPTAGELASAYGWSLREAEELREATLQGLRPADRLPSLRQSLIAVAGRASQEISVTYAYLHISNKQRTAEESLRDSEARYREIFNSAGDGICIVSGDMAVLDANPAMCRILGYSRSELLKLTVTDIKHPEHKEDINECLRQIELNGEARIETIDLRKDGSPVPVDLFVIPYTFGEQLAYLAIARDITERHHVQEDLRKRAERLEAQHNKLKAATEQKAKFFTSMSHELRTPMTSIVGFTELLLDDIEDPISPGQRQLLLKVSQNAHRLLGMVNDLLDLARAESGRYVANVTEVELGKLINHIVENMKPLAKDKDLDIAPPSAGSIPMAYTDEDKLSQILVNLLSNAIKFTPSGRITIGAQTDNGRIRISISDTGIGIARSELDKIFEEFHTISRSGKHKPPGTGLGLAITKKLCELLGGKISVSSEVGKGSTFTVTLPNKPPADQ